MSKTSLFRVVILIPILSLAAAGQAPVSDWENVKMLAPGTEVRVVSGTSKPIVGTLESVTERELVVLTQRTGPQSFPRPQIVSVSVKKSDHRRRNTLLGLGVGTLAGVVIGAGVGAVQANNCRGFLCGLAVPVDAAAVGAIGLVGGMLTGLFWPTGGWRQIYAP